jgi:hypothetical protein
VLSRLSSSVQSTVGFLQKLQLGFFLVQQIGTENLPPKRRRWGDSLAVRGSLGVSLGLKRTLEPAQSTCSHARGTPEERSVLVQARKKDFMTRSNDDCNLTRVEATLVPLQ